MFVRVCSFAIFAFWAVMTFLLVRSQFAPDTLELLALPPEHLWNMMYRQSQTSELTVLNGKDRVGFIALQPRGDAMTQTMRLSFDGNFSGPITEVGRQRFAFSGFIESGTAVPQVAGNISVRSRDADTRLQFWVDQSKQSVMYQVDSGGIPIASGTVTAGQSLDFDWLHDLGMDSTAFAGLAGQFSKPLVEVHRVQTQVHGESTDVYRVSVTQGETQIAELIVNQVGQVIRATSLFGYNAYAEDLLP